MGTVVGKQMSRANSRRTAILACVAFACVACLHTQPDPEHPPLDENTASNPPPSVTPDIDEALQTTGTANHADSRPEVTTPSPTARQVAPVEVALPADWSSTPRDAFAADLQRWLPIDGRIRLDAASIATLSRALRPSDENSVRAAVILGRTQDPRAGDVLLARLEARVPERPGMLFAGDVVAAAAFSSGASAPDAGARLEALSRGSGAHPVLDVRVECAAASLLLGRDGAIPFLLAFLREGTSAQDPRPDWTRLDFDDERLLRLQDRAARALSAHLGIACAFRAHASVAVRESEIARLSNLIANRGRASSR